LAFGGGRSRRRTDALIGSRRKSAKKKKACSRGNVRGGGGWSKRGERKSYFQTLRGGIGKKRRYEVDLGDVSFCGRKRKRSKNRRIGRTPGVEGPREFACIKYFQPKKRGKASRTSISVEKSLKRGNWRQRMTLSKIGLRRGKERGTSGGGDFPSGTRIERVEGIKRGGGGVMGGGIRGRMIQGDQRS